MTGWCARCSVVNENLSTCVSLELKLLHLYDLLGVPSVLTNYLAKVLPVYEVYSG